MNDKLLKLALWGREEEKEQGEFLNSKLAEAIKTLSPREYRVLELRYSDNGLVVLKVIGKDFRVTGERIRQIEAKALRKLRLFCRHRK